MASRNDNVCKIKVLRQKKMEQYKLAKMYFKFLGDKDKRGFERKLLKFK